MHYINKKKKKQKKKNQKTKQEMYFRVHNNDLYILLRSVHYSAKLQIAKIQKNVQNQKCYLSKAIWEFEFSYKLYLSKTL